MTGTTIDVKFRDKAGRKIWKFQNAGLFCKLKRNASWRFLSRYLTISGK